MGNSLDAGASSVTVVIPNFYYKGKKVQILLKDNGVGFPKEWVKKTGEEVNFELIRAGRWCFASKKSSIQGMHGGAGMGMILTSLFLSDSMVNGEMCISNRSGEVSGAQLTFKSATSISHDSNLQKIRLTMGYGKVKQQQKLAIERDDALRFNSITPVEHNLEYFPYPSEIDRFLISGLTKSKLSKGSCGSKRPFVGAGLGPEVGEVPKSYDYKEPPSSIKRCAELGIPKLSLAESSSHLSPISDRSDSSFRLSSCSTVSSNRLGYFSPASSIASEDSSPLRESESSSKFKKLKVK